MELTLVNELPDRSLEHRCNIFGMAPIQSALNPGRSFVPAELMIWWQVKDREKQYHTMHSYAWPAERESRMFAEWRDQAQMPEWIQERSEAVRRDLLANTATHTPDIRARWAYGLDRRWAVDGAEALPPNLHGESFVPVELKIGWTFNTGMTDRDHRYSIYAYSTARDGKKSNRTCTQYGSSRAAFVYGSEDLPEWIRELAEAQYGELEAIAAAHTAEREAR